MEGVDIHSGNLSLDALIISLERFNTTRLVDTESPIAERVFPRTASLNLTIIRQLKSRSEVFYPLAFFGQYQTKAKKRAHFIDTVELVPFIWMTTTKRLVTYEGKAYTYLELNDLSHCLSNEQLTRLSQSLEYTPVEMVALYKMDAETANSKE